MPSWSEAAERRVLLALLAFGGISAVAGGLIGIVANGAGVPLSYLHGSPFDSYLVPGILLGVVIGGTQLAAALAILAKQRSGLILSVVAGLGMLIWIFAELAIITEYSPLQTVYFALGVGELLTVFLTLGLLNPRSWRQPKRVPRRVPIR